VVDSPLVDSAVPVLGFRTVFHGPLNIDKTVPVAGLRTTVIDPLGECKVFSEDGTGVEVADKKTFPLAINRTTAALATANFPRIYIDGFPTLKI
jgi:hypothetical protein